MPSPVPICRTWMPARSCCAPTFCVTDCHPSDTKAMGRFELFEYAAFGQGSVPGVNVPASQPAPTMLMLLTWENEPMKMLFADGLPTLMELVFQSSPVQIIPAGVVLAPTVTLPVPGL